MLIFFLEFEARDYNVLIFDFITICVFFLSVVKDSKNASTLRVNFVEKLDIVFTLKIRKFSIINEILNKLYYLIL